MSDDNVDLARKVGAFIRSLRKIKGFTQADFSKHVSISSKTLYTIEVGDRLPTGLETINISRFFGITTDELLSAGGLVDLEYNSDLPNDLEVMRSEIAEFAVLLYSFYKLSHKDKEIIGAIIFKMLNSDPGFYLSGELLNESNKIRKKIKTSLYNLDDGFSSLGDDEPNSVAFFSKLIGLDATMPTELIYYLIAALDSKRIGQIFNQLKAVKELDEDKQLALFSYVLDSIKTPK